MSKGIARATLKRLHENGIVFWTEREKDGARVWHIKPQRDEKEIARDVFAELSAEESIDVATLCERTGDSASDVRTALKTLCSGGLAVPSEGAGGKLLVRLSAGVMRAARRTAA